MKIDWFIIDLIEFMDPNNKEGSMNDLDAANVPPSDPQEV